MSTILQFYTRQTSSNSIFFLRKANTDRKVIESSIKPTSKIGTRLSNTRVNLSQPHSTRIANTKMDKVWVPCNGIPSTTFVVVLLIACAKKKSKKKEQAKKKLWQTAISYTRSGPYHSLYSNHEIRDLRPCTLSKQNARASSYLPIDCTTLCMIIWQRRMRLPTLK